MRCAASTSRVVAGAVAEHVVDDLEAVQVDVQQAQSGVAGVGQAQGDPFEDRVAVHQPGQGVGLRLHAQAVLGVLAFGDVLQGAAEAVAAGIVRIRLADHAHPERRAIGLRALQLQFEASAVADRFQDPLQALPVLVQQAGQDVRHRRERTPRTEDPVRLASKIERVADPVPLPTADLRQFLHAVEQRLVALQFGDVAAEAEHHFRTIRARRELRHRGHRQPQQSLRAAPEQADHLAADRLSGGQRARAGMRLERQEAAGLVHHQPVVPVGRAVERLVATDPVDAACRGVHVMHPAKAILQGDRLVDALDQADVAGLGMMPGAEVAGDRHQRIAAVEDQGGRMHLHREAGAVGAHVGDLDDVGVAAVERFQHRHQ